MAPDSRIILVRHAQAEHNVDCDYSIPDARLTPLGRLQAAELARRLGELQGAVDLVECDAWPCDRGVGRAALEADAELGAAGAGAFDLSALAPDGPRGDWTSKAGFWAPDAAAVAARAAWVRRWLRGRA
ncbi:hypothetical protein GGS23DRAFT_592090 [Durotheca rogersii]|uniref:uncharacterized protein n=1 Tax=Durotheca rogersii TaxID=419775 RepID=UPI00221F206D|nr:uncharacterized protein GGS23DRAFT_592090 [Durotheca rogersii]KAI5868306.1 hypothetical protein GGS23DRAFT_592090 [Durotheca rogersii]